MHATKTLSATFEQWLCDCGMQLRERERCGEEQRNMWHKLLPLLMRCCYPIYMPLCLLLLLFLCCCICPPSACVLVFFLFFFGAVNVSALCCGMQRIKRTSLHFRLSQVARKCVCVWCVCGECVCGAFATDTMHMHFPSKNVC